MRDHLLICRRSKKMFSCKVRYPDALDCRLQNLDFLRHLIMIDNFFEREKIPQSKNAFLLPFSHDQAD